MGRLGGPKTLRDTPPGEDAYTDTESREPWNETVFKEQE
jgi:hypothetical protein